MLKPLLKYAAPLMLVFALLFLSGAAQAAVAVSGAQAADICCEKEARPQAPEPEGDCADPGCRCLSCSASLLFETPMTQASVASSDSLPCSLARFLPPAPERSIDYPPEIL